MAMPRKIKRPTRLGVVLAGLLAALTFGAVAAQSDNVVNDIAANPGSDTINAGGSTSVGYRIVATGGDSQPGCNASDATPPTVTIHAPPAVAVVPGSLTFTSCGTFKNATFSSSTVGDYLITVTVADAGPGAYNTMPARWTLHVVNSPPTVTISGVADGGSYTKGSVPTAVCHVTDTEDGLSDDTGAATPSLSAITGPYADDGIGQQTAECSYTDTGGLSATASATYSIVDSSPPDISYVVDGTLGNNGWYTSDVSLTWNVSEPDSPSSLATVGCADQSITADQAETTYDCAATSAGGSSGPVSVSISVTHTLRCSTAELCPPAGKPTTSRSTARLPTSVRQASSRPGRSRCPRASPTARRRTPRTQMPRRSRMTRATRRPRNTRSWSTARARR
jgi:hypothetical protein